MAPTTQAPAPSTKRHAHLFWLVFLAVVGLLIAGTRLFLFMSQTSAVPIFDWVK